MTADDDHVIGQGPDLFPSSGAMISALTIIAVALRTAE